MRVDEMDQGVFCIAFIEESGKFLRGRIDELCTDFDFCYFYSIDNCDYHVVQKENIYHIDEEFTRRHPQVPNFILLSIFPHLCIFYFNMYNFTLRVHHFLSLQTLLIKC